jgi:hypothetical protein
VQTDAEAGFERCPDVRQAIRISGTGEEKIAFLFCTHTRLGKEEAFVVSKWKVIDSTASVSA